MTLHKQTLERSPWRDTISIQTVNKDFLSNSAQHNHTKYGTSLYELIPKKFSEFYLVLHKLYRVDNTLESVGDFIKVDKQHPNYYGFKKQLFGQVQNPYNTFPKLIQEAWGKPILPDNYIKIFGEFYNYKAITTYLWCTELDKVKPYSRIKFFIVRLNNDFKIFFIEDKIGKFEDINPYWTIAKYDGIESVKQLLEEKESK